MSSRRYSHKESRFLNKRMYLERMLGVYGSVNNDFNPSNRGTQMLDYIKQYDFIIDHAHAIFQKRLKWGSLIKDDGIPPTDFYPVPQLDDEEHHEVLRAVNHNYDRYLIKNDHSYISRCSDFYTDSDSLSELSFCGAVLDWAKYIKGKQAISQGLSLEASEKIIQDHRELASYYFDTLCQNTFLSNRSSLLNKTPQNHGICEQLEWSTNYKCNNAMTWKNPYDNSSYWVKRNDRPLLLGDFKTLEQKMINQEWKDYIIFPFPIVHQNLYGEEGQKKEIIDFLISPELSYSMVLNLAIITCRMNYHTPENIFPVQVILRADWRKYYAGSVHNIRKEDYKGLLWMRYKEKDEKNDSNRFHETRVPAIPLLVIKSRDDKKIPAYKGVVDNFHSPYSLLTLDGRRVDWGNHSPKRRVTYYEIKQIMAYTRQRDPNLRWYLYVQYDTNEIENLNIKNIDSDEDTRLHWYVSKHPPSTIDQYLHNTMSSRYWPCILIWSDEIVPDLEGTYVLPYGEDSINLSVVVYDSRIYHDDPPYLFEDHHKYKLIQPNTETYKSLLKYYGWNSKRIMKNNVQSGGSKSRTSLTRGKSIITSLIKERKEYDKHFDQFIRKSLDLFFVSHQSRERYIVVYEEFLQAMANTYDTIFKKKRSLSAVSSFGPQDTLQMVIKEIGLSPYAIGKLKGANQELNKDKLFVNGKLISSQDYPLTYFIPLLYLTQNGTPQHVKQHWLLLSYKNLNVANTILSIFPEDSVQVILINPNNISENVFWENKWNNKGKRLSIIYEYDISRAFKELNTNNTTKNADLYDNIVVDILSVSDYSILMYQMCSVLSHAIPLLKKQGNMLIGCRFPNNIKDSHMSCLSHIANQFHHVNGCITIRNRLYNPQGIFTFRNFKASPSKDAFLFSTYYLDHIFTNISSQFYENPPFPSFSSSLYNCLIQAFQVYIEEIKNMQKRICKRLQLSSPIPLKQINSHKQYLAQTNFTFPLTWNAYDTHSYGFQLLDNHVTSTQLYIPEVRNYEGRCHWGQFKLLLSEIDFLNRVTRKWKSQMTIPKLVVYAGSANGLHIPILADMFPDVWFHLYDGNKFASNVNKHPRISTWSGNEGFVTDEKVSRTILPRVHGFRKMNPQCVILFMSDIRLSPSDEAVHKDMISQAKWTKMLNADMALLKFRLPYPKSQVKDEPYEYLKGIIQPQIYAPIHSTESRLIVDKSDSYKKTLYYPLAYERQMYAFNSIQRRIFFLDAPPLDLFLYGYDRGIESLLFFSIIRNYLENTGNFPPKLSEFNQSTLTDLFTDVSQEEMMRTCQKMLDIENEFKRLMHPAERHLFDCSLVTIDKYISQKNTKMSVGEKKTILLSQNLIKKRISFNKMIFNKRKILAN